MQKSVCICGTGSYVPKEVVTNEMLEKTAPDTNAQWVETKLGIKARRRVSKDECTSDIAFEAGRKAIENAGLKPEDIELIILATVTPDRLVPSASTIVQRKLGAINAVAFDINAGCPGFIFAFSTGAQFLQTGYFKNALIIGADALSRALDYTERNCVFFADGAGAVVIKAAESENGVKGMYFGSDGEGTDDLTQKGCGSEYQATYELLESGDQYIFMDGKEVYKAASVKMPLSIEIALKRANLTVEDITHVVPHQPNISLLYDSVDKLGIPREIVKITLDRYGNFSSGNIPMALDEMNRDGELKDGDVLAFTSAGAGWCWGGMIVKWGV
ncbi:MAG: ketoacyl-ACP synthase III [Halanaerobiales bacterium]|nr:ketoacyl-ACP synthase III [Halanaerobiales bacterium]